MDSHHSYNPRADDGREYRNPRDEGAGGGDSHKGVRDLWFWVSCCLLRVIRGSNDDLTIRSIDHYTQCQARSKTTMERGLGRPKLRRQFVVDWE